MIGTVSEVEAYAICSSGHMATLQTRTTTTECLRAEQIKYNNRSLSSASLSVPGSFGDLGVMRNIVGENAVE